MATGYNAPDTTVWIEELFGWRVDLDVVADLVTATHGDQQALEGAVRQANDVTDLLVRPHRPLDVLASPGTTARVISALDESTIAVALLYVLGDGDSAAVTASLDGLADADAARTAALDAHLLKRVPGGLAAPDGQTAAALWHDAPDAQRTWALETLARHTAEPDAHAWYRAWGAVGPDDVAAAALIETSDSALARGDTVDAASALEIAGALTTNRERKVSVRLRAAELFFVAGLPRHALALLRQTVASTVTPIEAAMMHRMIGRILMFDGDLRGAEAHLLAHAAPLASRDADLGLLLSAEALWVRAVDGRLAEALGLISDPDHDAPRFVKSCWTGLRSMMGTGVEQSELDERFEEFKSMPADDPETTMVGYVIVHASIGMEAFATAEAVLSTLLQRDVREGAAANRALLLAGAAELAWWQGDWVVSRSWARQAIDIADRGGDNISPARAIMTLARIQFASDEAAEAHALVDERLRTIPGWSRPALLAARGHGNLIAGDIDHAIADLTAAVAAETQPGSGLPHPKLSAVGPDFCSALAAAGRLDEARSWLERWRSGPSATGSWELGAARRCDALLRTGSDATTAGDEAVVLLEGFVYEQARALVEQANRQIDAGALEDARSSLRAALPRFIGLGASTWTKSTEAALDGLASREVGGVQRYLALLSDQDREIVRCVVLGSTNRQVADELYLSPKTVENRLTAIYATLGVRNRVDLARLVSE